MPQISCRVIYGFFHKTSLLPKSLFFDVLYLNVLMIFRISQGRLHLGFECVQNCNIILEGLSFNKKSMLMPVLIALICLVVQHAGNNYECNFPVSNNGEPWHPYTCLDCILHVRSCRERESCYICCWNWQPLLHNRYSCCSLLCRKDVDVEVSVWDSLIHFGHRS